MTSLAKRTCLQLRSPPVGRDDDSHKTVLEEKTANYLIL